MPSPSNSPETAAIEAAYRAHVELLFKSLVTNLGDQVVSHQSDQQSLDKFKVGLNIAKRAKQLALNAVVSASPARIAASPGKKRKGKQSRGRREP
jgi:hypothetical protein